MYDGQTKSNPVFTGSIAQRPSLFSKPENAFIQLIGKHIRTIPWRDLHPIRVRMYPQMVGRKFVLNLLIWHMRPAQSVIIFN